MREFEVSDDWSYAMFSGALYAGIYWVKGIKNAIIKHLSKLKVANPHSFQPAQSMRRLTAQGN